MSTFSYIRIRIGISVCTGIHALMIRLLNDAVFKCYCKISHGGKYPKMAENSLFHFILSLDCSYAKFNADSISGLISAQFWVVREIIAFSWTLVRTDALKFHTKSYCNLSFFSCYFFLFPSSYTANKYVNK